MNYLEDSKAVTKINAADLTTATTFTMSIDTLGFAYASVDVIFEPVLAAGTNSTVAISCNLQQSDTDSAFVNVTGFVGGELHHPNASQHQRHQRCAVQSRLAWPQALPERVCHAAGRIGDRCQCKTRQGCPRPNVGYRSWRQGCCVRLTLDN